MTIPILEATGPHAAVVEALGRISSRLKDGAVLVTVARVPKRSLSPKELAAIQELGATETACGGCGEKCWWSAATRAVPGPLVPVCIECIQDEVDEGSVDWMER